MQEELKNSEDILIECQPSHFERLQSVEKGEGFAITLFFSKSEDSVDLLVLDIERKKNQANTKGKKWRLQSFKQFIQDSIRNLNSASPLIQIFLSAQQIDQLNNQNSRIRLACKDVSHINKKLKRSVIVTIKLPHGFFSFSSLNYHLEGYILNPRGRMTRGWGRIYAGRFKKVLKKGQPNRKDVSQLDQNQFYKKNQLREALAKVEAIFFGKFKQDDSKLQSELQTLGENFIHSEKFLTNQTSILPVLNVQLECVCSLQPDLHHRNQIKQTKKIISEDDNISVCLNLEAGQEVYTRQLQSMVQEIFRKQQTDSKMHVLTHTETNTPQKNNSSFLLSAIPIKISNPHIFLKTQKKTKFLQYFVKGLYEYYHYGDERFNDQGWGCAYRALQTLLSWFRLQGKLNILELPSIPQIQNIIDMIDVTSTQKLSNTNTWIGATQVAWVVKKLTGYDCQILHIRDGKDIVEQAEIFRNHFETVGSPIMYGGDQYAYSIVGINYSWQFGEISFLILDPHYNGNDKVEKIVEKKGVCWRKPEEMFKKGVFYNFCLPLLE